MIIEKYTLIIKDIINKSRLKTPSGEYEISNDVRVFCKKRRRTLTWYI